MTRINPADLEQLQQGIPPSNPDLLTQMTLGRGVWLDRVREHYLENYLADGGSKVKVLVGDAGTGKTHLLRSVAQDAQMLGYATVYLSARKHKLNDLPGLYQAIVAQLDMDALVQGVCCYVAAELGYGRDRYEGRGSLTLEVMTEHSPMTGRFLYTPNAIKDVCELFRQLIDDVELLSHFLLLAGRPAMIQDERLRES